MIEYILKVQSSIPFNQCSIASFIDCSGSTASQCNHFSNKSILDVERELVTKISPNNITYWSTCVNKGSYAYAAGGTEPSCIFSDMHAKKLFNENEIIVFTTDGEISQQEVSKFAKNLESNINKTLYICIIVNTTRSNNLNNLNISVISPFMFASNVLCLFHDGTTSNTYVIASKGPISSTYTNPSIFDTNSLEKLDVSALTELSLTSQVIPNNFVVLSETPENYKVLDKNKLLARGAILPELSVDDWDVLIKYCTVNNTMDKLRTIITDSKNHELEIIKNKADSDYTCTYVPKRDELISKMTDAYLSGDTETQKILKIELDQVYEHARNEENEYWKFINNSLHPIKYKYETLRERLHSIETCGNKYSLNNFAYSSNRAGRAKDVEDLPEDSITRLTHYNVPNIQCVIHLDEGPAILWLGKNDDIEYSTNDFCLNYPLAHYPKLVSILLSNPVCADCANFYFSKFKKTTYGQDTVGYLTLDYSNKNNYTYNTNILCRSLTNNKFLSHVNMLLLSILDDSNLEWLTCKDFLVDQLINNIITTDTLTEEGKKDKLVNILPKLITDSGSILRQPFYAACRLLKFAIIYHGKSKNPNINDKGQITLISNAINAFISRFCYSLVESYSQKTKHDNTEKINETLESLIFVTVCGIPNPIIKQMTFDNLKDFLGEQWFKMAVEFINKLFDVLNYDKNIILTEKLLLCILWQLCNITIHEKPLTMYTNITKNKLLLNSMQFTINNNISDNSALEITNIGCVWY